jgi:hypothetical protein
MSARIHILCLKNNKWFLYVSRCPADNWNYICKEAATLFEYVRENQPIMVFDSQPYMDIFQLDARVKQYMKYYGIENVRGGSYSTPVLLEHRIKAIEEELFQDTGMMDHNILLIEEIHRTYEDWHPSSDNFAGEIHRLQQKLDNFRAIKEKCHSITTNRTVFEDLDWIKKRAHQVKLYCDSNSTPSIVSNLEITNYKRIIETMQQLTRQFRGFLEENRLIYDDSHLLLEKPYVQLDTLFYHSHLIHDSGIYFSRIEKMLNYFEYMAWVVVNRSEEFHFDLGQYETHFEKKTEYAIQYLRNAELCPTEK